MFGIQAGAVGRLVAVALTPLAAAAGLAPRLLALACVGVGGGAAMPAMDSPLLRKRWSLARYKAARGHVSCCYRLVLLPEQRERHVLRCARQLHPDACAAHCTAACEGQATETGRSK